MPQGAQDDVRPEHDPVAEEMDLLTLQEAGARLYDRIEQLRIEAVSLPPGSPDLDALDNQIRALQSAITRTRGRTP